MLLKKKKKEKAEKEAVEKKQAEMQKAIAKKSEEAEMQAVADANLKNNMQKDAEAKKQSRAKKKEKNKAEATAEKVVFDDGKGTIAHRKEMQSLAPGIEIEKQIINTLVTMLNYKERIRADGKDLKRRYFPTVLLNEEKDQAKEYESFKIVIKNQMNASGSKKKMKDV
ncbi:hypothetical protein Tco_0536461 [Tanacetum coccineum]